MVDIAEAFKHAPHTPNSALCAKEIAREVMKRGIDLGQFRIVRQVPSEKANSELGLQSPKRISP